MEALSPDQCHMISTEFARPAILMDCTFTQLFLQGTRNYTTVTSSLQWPSTPLASQPPSVTILHITSSLQNVHLSKSVLYYREIQQLMHHLRSSLKSSTKIISWISRGGLLFSTLRGVWGGRRGKRREGGGGGRRIYTQVVSCTNFAPPPTPPPPHPPEVRSQDIGPTSTTTTRLIQNDYSGRRPRAFTVTVSSWMPLWKTASCL